MPRISARRAPLGSQERFTAYLTEHFAGAFPIWLAPQQIRVIPVMPAVTPYAQEVSDVLFDAGFRVEVDESDGRLSGRVRAAATRKIPLIVVVGRREVESRSVTVRYRSGAEQSMTLDEFVSTTRQLVDCKSLEWAGHVTKD